MSAPRSHARLVVPAATTVALVLASPLAAAAAWASGNDGKGARSSGSTASQSDPAGNNGTIKVDGVALDDSRGNEPQVACTFAVDFYGFDEGDTADITFTAKAPTGSGTLLSQRGVTISDDAAGGGQDRDATLTYTAELLGLTGAAPHRNGWHVKVAVDVLEAPGGAKQKVFWLDCDRPTGTAGSTTGTTTGTTRTGTANTGAATGTTSTDAARVGAGTDTIDTGTATAVAGVFAEAASAGGAVSGQSVSAAALPAAGTGSGALPTTGGELAVLVLLGLAGIGVGTAGVLAGRASHPTQPA